MAQLPPDHDDRMELVRTSLAGLSVGDAFGQQFFYFPEFIASRTLPVPPWHYTDDTAMALGLAEVLKRRGAIDRDVLAETFARNYAADPARGYGGGAHELLRAVHAGTSWREASRGLFGGQGSFGNGAAMRVAPVGAYFHDDLDRVAREASRSAEVTHAHAEGVAGAVAVAVAAALATSDRAGSAEQRGARMLAEVLRRTPEGETRAGLAQAAEIGFEESPIRAASVLGSGDQITAMDTVPFVVWSAASSLDDFEAALWRTVSALGDRDTTCAMVGGIVALSAGAESIPAEWRRSREGLPTI